MTSAELIRAVRLSFIEAERNDAILAQMPPKRRRESVAANRRIRAHRRELFKSEAFQNLAQGYIATGKAGAVAKIHGLITWLSILKSVANGGVSLFEGRPAGDGGADFSPQMMIARAAEQQRLRLQHVTQLREIGATLSAKYAGRLQDLASEIENDQLALFGTEVGPWMVGNPENVGRSGSATVNAAGAWRGWFIRELHARLPRLDLILQPYSTIAALLTWAGIDDVNTILVRSILKRGNT